MLSAQLACCRDSGQWACCRYSGPIVDTVDMLLTKWACWRDAICLLLTYVHCTVGLFLTQLTSRPVVECRHNVPVVVTVDMLLKQWACYWYNGLLVYTMDLFMTLWACWWYSRPFVDTIVQCACCSHSGLVDDTVGLLLRQWTCRRHSGHAVKTVGGKRESAGARGATCKFIASLAEKCFKINKKGIKCHNFHLRRAINPNCCAKFVKLCASCHIQRCTPTKFSQCQIAGKVM